MSNEIEYFFLFAQLLNLSLLTAWVVLAIAALLRMRTLELSEELKILWVLVVFFVPVLGATAFLMLHSRKREPSI